MSAKEKAKELIGKMKYHYDKQVNPYFIAFTDDDLAKRCALIAADEVLGYMGADRGTEFWQEVRSEIEKL
jgi:predicted TPR repeat methyltransferase